MSIAYDQFLLPHEKVVRHERMAKAWAVEHLLVSLLVAVVLWGGLGVLASLTVEAPQPFERAAIAAFTLHILFSLLYEWRRLATAHYIVTEEAVYARHGQIVLTVASALLDRVTDLHVHTSLVGRLFGYSGLSVRTAGGGVWMPGIRDPFTLRSAIQESRHRLLARLLQEAGRGGPAPDRLLSDLQCPNCETVFQAERRRPLEVTCPHCTATGAVFEEARP